MSTQWQNVGNEDLQKTARQQIMSTLSSTQRVNSTPTGTLAPNTHFTARYTNPTDQCA